MPVPFSPSTSALVLIDHQLGTMQLIKTQPLETVRKATLALAKMARVFNLPVVLTSSQETQLQGPMLPELKEILPDAFARRVQRTGIVNAWSDPNFVNAVERTGRRDLIMAGVTTDICLIYPAISALEAGFRVQAVMDGSGSPFHDSEALSRQRMHDAGVVLTTANTLIAELTQDWSTPEGNQLIQLLFTDLLPRIEPAAR